MSDHEGVQGPQGAPPPAPSPPRRVACPRCQGTFEGNPDFCPHCGFAKTDIPALKAQATPTPTAAPQPAAVPPVTAPLAAEPAPEQPQSEPVASDFRTSKKPLRLLIAGAVLLVTAGAAGWWVTGGGGDDDPCAQFREQVEQVQSRDFANSREERRALAEVTGQALDAGCDLNDPGAEDGGRQP